MLIYDNYAFNKCKPKPSNDGNISYRCVKKKNRNLEDIERDIKIAQLKYRHLNNHITLETFMKSTAFMYSYESQKSNDKLHSSLNIKNHLSKHYYYDYFQSDQKHPNLNCLQKKIICIY